MDNAVNAANPGSRCVAISVGGLTACVGTVGSVAMGWFLATRGSCDANYIRLFDLAPAAFMAMVLTALAGITTAAVAWSDRRHPVAAVTGSVFLGVGVLVGWVAMALITAGPKADCWTF